MYPWQMQFTKQTFFLSHDIQGYGQGWKTYKCALTVVDVASHFKEAEPLTLKDSTEVTSSFQKNY